MDFNKRRNLVRDQGIEGSGHSDTCVARTLTVRTIDTERLVQRLGRLSPDTVTAVVRGLQEMFAG